MDSNGVASLVFDDATFLQDDERIKYVGLAETKVHLSHLLIPSDDSDDNFTILPTMKLQNNEKF